MASTTIVDDNWYTNYMRLLGDHESLQSQLTEAHAEIERLKAELAAWDKMTLEIATTIADNAGA